MSGIAIPPERLSAQALQGLLEEYASRDGTDYGEQEVALATKVAQLRGQLAQGQVVIVYDEASETISLVLAQDLKNL